MHIPKTAGHSVKQAFVPWLHERRMLIDDCTSVRAEAADAERLAVERAGTADARL